MVGMVGPWKVGPKGVGARRGGRPKISRFFFSLPPETSLFLLSLGGLLVEFWWCLKRRALKCVRLEFSGCRVKPRRPQSRPGFTRQPENSCTFERPRHFKHHQNSTKGPTREGEKNESCGREREEEERNFGPPPPFGAPPFGASPFVAPGFATSHFPGLGLRDPTFCGPKIQHPKIGRSRNWPKSKLAEIEIGRSRNC